MAQPTARPAKLHPAAHRALEDLQRALPSQGLPREATLKDILSALALYTSPPQVAGMLAEYWRYTDQLAGDQAEDGDGE